ncbi:ABC transporter ATP-binding protein [Halomonas sp. BC04]|uniref:ABC transporter ATP-binding protein n=1 Tax=Halomonas sp. BC04 TaxID=1403540 RepID=UPI0003ED73EA|nr:ABC transporter ATP-binding protein [Halomonas sp. BC04]EWG98267.1 peptide ABC transporter ATP-binding protein [Halomonas sp. BC04]
MTGNNPLLSVKDLQVHFKTDDGIVPAVDGVSFDINEGETLAVVGESGSGKSVTSLAIMDLLPKGKGYVAGGELLFEGDDLVKMEKQKRHALRGNRISMIFQEPMTSLNPVFTCGYQIAEAVALHQKLDKKAAWKKAVEMLDLVSIPEPAQRAKEYPHQLSGGMRQRVMIAIALSCNPRLLIADEPTTALDVTIQAQILDLMRNLQKEIGTSILFITHDLAVVAEMADRVVVMYTGRAVEESGVFDIYERPTMPYTKGLLNSIPSWSGNKQGKKDRLVAIPGNVPSPMNLPPGCSFEPRCQYAKDICTKQVPPLESIGGDHRVRCVRWKEIESDINAGRS